MNYRKQSQTAMTLVEIMVVVAIISIILGVSSALVTQFNKRITLRMAAREVATTIRMAKNFAVESKSPGTVEIDSKKALISARGTRVVGYWHLEEIDSGITSGALGRHAQVANGQLVPGKIGDGVQLSGTGQIDCGPFSQFAIREGFAVSLWIYPQPSTQKETQEIWKIGSQYLLAVRGDGSLYLQSKTEITQIDDLYLPIHRWVHLRVVNTQELVTIYIDDIVAGLAAFSTMVDPFPDDHFVIAPSFEGIVDEVSLEAQVELRRYTLPGKISFVVAPESIEFNARSYLNPLKHLAATTIAIQDEAVTPNRRFHIDVSIMGKISIAEQE